MVGAGNHTSWAARQNLQKSEDSDRAQRTILYWTFDRCLPVDSPPIPPFPRSQEPGACSRTAYHARMWCNCGGEALRAVSDGSCLTPPRAPDPHTHTKHKQKQKQQVLKTHVRRIFCFVFVSGVPLYFVHVCVCVHVFFVFVVQGYLPLCTPHETLCTITYRIRRV